jgi:hypothetical protein
VSVEQKAARLLVEGRVTVLQADRGRGKAVVTGDHGQYELTFSGGYIECPCPSWVRRCSHAEAVARVVEVES